MERDVFPKVFLVWYPQMPDIAVVPIDARHNVSKLKICFTFPLWTFLLNVKVGVSKGFRDNPFLTGETQKLMHLLIDRLTKHIPCYTNVNFLGEVGVEVRLVTEAVFLRDLLIAKLQQQVSTCRGQPLVEFKYFAQIVRT